jgi:hypothetical protein
MGGSGGFERGAPARWQVVFSRFELCLVNKAGESCRTPGRATDKIFKD